MGLTDTTTATADEKGPTVPAPTAAATTLLLTPTEAATQLRISRSSLYVLLARGDLASVRVGGSRRIPARALNDFVRALIAETTTTPDRYDPKDAS